MGAKINKSSRGAAGLNFIDVDTAGSVSGSVAETTLCNITIPANSVKTRLLIFASCTFQETALDARYTTLRIKTGALGSETTKRFKYLGVNPHDNNYMQHCFLIYNESTLDFTQQQSVLLTAQNSDVAATSTATCSELIVIGQ